MFLAADCGYGREGLRWDSEGIVDVVRDIMVKELGFVNSGDFF